MNLSSAQEFFWSMGCSHFHMYREYQDRYEQYKKLGISKETEHEWTCLSFDASLKAMTDQDCNTAELPFKHSLLAELAVNIDLPRVAQEMLSATQAIRARLPAGSHIIVAETLLGRRSEQNPGGVISLAHGLGHIELATQLADLSLELCSESSARAGTDFTTDRILDCKGRLARLRARLCI